MKLKRPIQNTTELLDYMFPIVAAAQGAGHSDDEITSIGAAFAALVELIESMDAPQGGARNDTGKNEPPVRKTRAVFPEQYDRAENETLAGRLREYAEWADCNDWEVPLLLGNDLRLAAQSIEIAEQKLPWIGEIGNRMPEEKA